MPPQIGVTCSFGAGTGPTPRERSTLSAAYTDAIYSVGAAPRPIAAPATFDVELLDALLDGCDAMIFTGGYDLNPRTLGQPPHPRVHAMHPRRERFELALFRRTDERRIPTLAICLGHQIAHWIRGGHLIQHIENTPQAEHHRPKEADSFHEVEIMSGSRLAQIMQCARCHVDSRHHQAVDPARPGRGLRSVAFSADGVLEASEDVDGRFLITVQWHPESTFDQPEHRALFAALVEQAARARASSVT
jgi:putative glutamine amidotransferase